MLPPIYIGIDAGGSTTELRAEAGNHSLRRTDDGVNFQRDGADQSTGVLSRLIADALASLDHDGTGSICLGVAGAGRPEDQRRLAERLRQQFGASLDGYTLSVEHDARVALEAAFEGESGLLVIAGTGSVVLARTTTGTLERAGGWGLRVGDDGSGTAIGTAGLSAIAAAFDGGETTALSERFDARFGIASPEDLVRSVYADSWAVQDVAPLVVAAAEEGDRVSARILKAQADALAQRAQWLAARVTDIAPRIALMGGLTSEPFYRMCLTDALQKRLSGWAIALPSRRPVDGAFALARKIAAQNRDQEIDSGG